MNSSRSTKFDTFWHFFFVFTHFVIRMDGCYPSEPASMVFVEPEKDHFHTVRRLQGCTGLLHL